MHWLGKNPCIVLWVLKVGAVGIGCSGDAVVVAVARRWGEPHQDGSVWVRKRPPGAGAKGLGDKLYSEGGAIQVPISHSHQLF